MIENKTNVAVNVVVGVLVPLCLIYLSTVTTFGVKTISSMEKQLSNLTVKVETLTEWSIENKKDNERQDKEIDRLERLKFSNFAPHVGG